MFNKKRYQGVSLCSDYLLKKKTLINVFFFVVDKVALLKGQGREELGGFQSSNTMASETRTNLCSNTTRTTTVE